MGVRHRTLPLEGVQFHPESMLSEHGEALVRNFLSMSDPVDPLLPRRRRAPPALLLARRRRRPRLVGPPLDHRLARRRRRVAVVVGRPARGHPPRRRHLDRRRRRRLRRARGAHRRGRAVVRLPRLRRAHRPARHPRPRCSPTRSGCGRGRCGCSSIRWRPSGSPRWSGDSRADSAVATAEQRRTSPNRGAPEVPGTYAAAFARVQEHLHAGNSYEVNLTHRLTRALRPRPADGVPPAARAQPRAVQRVPPARRRRRARLAAVELAGALRARHRRPPPGDQADQGHHPARCDARGGRRAARAAGAPTRRPAPRT